MIETARKSKSKRDSMCGRKKMFQNILFDSSDLRSVQSIVDHTPETNTAKNQNVSISFAPKIETPVFGGPPTFVSIADHPLKTTRSIFGHISFGSNLPTFKSSRSNRIALRRTSGKTVKVNDSEWLHVNRTTVSLKGSWIVPNSKNLFKKKFDSH